MTTYLYKPAGPAQLPTAKMSNTTKFELVTQPHKEESPESVRDETLRKLLQLVQENTADSHSAEDKATEHVSNLNKDTSKGLDHTNEILEPLASPTLDEDGFEIPLGKIPLDGHFSTDEVKELVELSKEEGVLKDDVNVKVLESNEVVGDRIEVVEETAK